MSLSLDDLRFARDPAGIAKLYHLLGYNADPEPIANTPTEALFEGAVLTDLEGVYMLVDEADFQAVHFECKTALNTALIRRVSENFLKRSGYYLLSFRAPNNPNTVFVKPSRSDARVKITRLTLNPQRPSQHEFTVLKEIALAGTPSALEIHARQVKAFDVERVTKKFFETYHDLFERLRDQIKTLNPNTRIGMLQKNTTDDSPSLHAFTQRLLGRMLFLYFIQKKGWLNSQKHWGDGQQDFIVQLYKTRVQSEAVNFYRDILEPLFFETLNRQRPNHHSQFGRIPYLNGSLFEREYPETTVLNLPNALFDPSNTDNSILGILERFNFTIEESSSLEQDVSLDPEMLGKVFENLMESDEAAKSGTFYTPRSIVQFLAEESLTRYLSDATQIDLARLRQLTSDDDEYGNLERQEADDIIKALAAVRVLDPAVGTASMLVGMLNVMIRIRRSAEARRGMRVQLGTPVIGDWKKQYINHCLYGVDIKQEAIEIGRLRLWLSLVVDAQEPEPLPNLDYKLMAGDGVLETMDGTRFGDTGALLGEDAKINDLIKRIEVTRDAFFSEESPLERKKKRDVLMQLERELFGFDVDWRVKNLDEEITILRRRAHNKKGDTAKDLDLTTRLNTLVDLKNKVLQDLEPLPFFLHRVHFSEVMQRQNAGFDIVLGNPPYVRMEKLEKSVKDALKNAFADVHSGTADLYVYFYRKGIELLRQNGRLAFITPNKFLRAGYGQAIRDFLAQQTTLEMLIDFGDLPVFDATTYPFITVARKAIPSKDHSLEMIPEKTLKNRIGDARENGVVGVREALNAFHDYARELILPLQQQTLRKEGWVLGDPNVLALLEKLRGTGLSLNEFVDGKFYYGIKTGLNEAFVIDRATRDALIAEDPKSAELIKPLYRGRDVKRWKAQFAERYLLIVPSSADENSSNQWKNAPNPKKAEEIFKASYSSIYAYLKPLEHQLKKRSDQGVYWWELRSCAYYSEFEAPKIVWAKYGIQLAFIYDKSGSYYLDTNYFAVTGHKWLVPLIHSNLMQLFAMNTFNIVQGGYLEVITQSVSKLPIVQPNPQQQAILESITDDSRITELNAVVYQMYGLTPEEITLVETHTAGVAVGAETDLDEE